MKNKLNNLISNGEFDRKNSLSQYNYANLFNVVNKGEKSYFNLCKGISFKNNNSLDKNLFEEYIVNEDDSWTIISYKCFETIELWWLICKFNDIKNPFTELTAGMVLRIPNEELRKVILTTIQTI